MQSAGWLCSFPTCRTPTVGATSAGEGEINIGTAAHICAAAPGGPRYDETMLPGERSSTKNGIWMCRDHGKAIDSTDPEFTVERLRKWKRQVEIVSWRRVLRNETLRKPTVATDMELAAQIRTAAEADLKVFRQTVKWPSTSVALTLKVNGFDDPVTTSGLAGAVTSLDDLILVAGPGMGKTTTLFQIAQGVLAAGNGMPFVVPLGDWATEGATVLESILKRSAFRGTSENDFREAVVARTANSSSVVSPSFPQWIERHARFSRPAKNAGQTALYAFVQPANGSWMSEPNCMKTVTGAAGCRCCLSAS